MHHSSTHVRILDMLQNALYSTHTRKPWGAVFVRAYEVLFGTLAKSKAFSGRSTAGRASRSCALYTAFFAGLAFAGIPGTHWSVWRVLAFELQQSGMLRNSLSAWPLEHRVSQMSRSRHSVCSTFQ